MMSKHYTVFPRSNAAATIYFILRFSVATIRGRPSRVMFITYSQHELVIFRKNQRFWQKPVEGSYVEMIDAVHNVATQSWSKFSNFFLSHCFATYKSVMFTKLLWLLSNRQWSTFYPWYMIGVTFIKEGVTFVP